MDGENRVILMNKPEDGEYSIRMPNMYARGILFGTSLASFSTGTGGSRTRLTLARTSSPILTGKLILELGDTSAVKNVKTGISCDVEFKTKGFFSGTYNAVVGKVKKDATPIGDLDGFWSDSMVYKDVKVRSSAGLQARPLVACD